RRDACPSWLLPHLDDGAESRLVAASPPRIDAMSASPRPARTASSRIPAAAETAGRRTPSWPASSSASATSLRISSVVNATGVESGSRNAPRLYSKNGDASAPPASTSYARSRSIPKRSAKTRVSARDSFVTATIELTTSFIAAPEPEGPSSACPLVIESSTGVARSYAPSSPPTIAKSCAASATETLPETGASSRRTPCSSASRASSVAAVGPIVLISTTTDPGRRAERSPLADSTSRTASPSVSIVTTTSAPASAEGAGTATAPSSTSGSAREAVRFQTTSGKPARRTFRAIGRPIRPRPAKPTVGVSDKNLPAVHHVHLPGHVVGLGRREVDEKRRDLLRARRPADERAGRELAHRVGVLRLVVDRPDVFVQADPHRRVHDARRERVHGDPVLDQPACRRLRDGERPELRHAVRNEVPEALAARDRSRVDDLPARALGDHLLRRLLRADDHAPGVDAHDLLEVLLVDLHEAARAIHAGVVEDDVQLAEGVDGLPDHRLHLCAVGDVDADRLRFPAVGRDRLRDAARRVCVQVGHEDLAALARDRPAGCGPDPAGTAGDDDDATLDSAHQTGVASRSSRSAPRTYVLPQTSSSSAGNLVITRQPVAVTTSSSSIRAADSPSVAGQ